MVILSIVNPHTNETERYTFRTENQALRFAINTPNLGYKIEKQPRAKR